MQAHFGIAGHAQLFCRHQLSGGILVTYGHMKDPIQDEAKGKDKRRGGKEKESEGGRGGGGAGKTGVLTV